MPRVSVAGARATLQGIVQSLRTKIVISAEKRDISQKCVKRNRIPPAQNQILSSTTNITLNSEEIEIQSACFKAADAGDQSINAEVKYEPENATVVLSFPSSLQPGNGQLSIDFTGQLNDKMKGFYRSKYLSPSGEEMYAAVTQFEATDARRAFPCWDEPAVKATFDVTLVVPKNRVALSNMPVKSENDLPEDSAWKVVTYERTPIMSTYLLAFVVGEYDYVEAKDADGVMVRVYTPVGKKEQGQFALEVAVKTLPFYKDYFKIAYPLPKIDLIAIADFAAGAMENWGLVTYRETALLIDPKNSSSKTKQWVALVVGHELAHQWFGNLVTMEWWTHLWLNEGFASWIEYLCVDHCFPEFDIWTQFVNSDLGRALEMDALHNSHAIEIPVGHPDEVDEIFDAISYSKGASVIRMLHDYVGDESFRKGMNQYLTKFKYKNAVTEDLWESLGTASGKPVLDVMTTWTKQMGYPVVKVTERQDGSNRILTLTQEKFCANGIQPKDGSYTWMVPVSISAASNPKKPAVITLLDKPTQEVTVPNVKPDEWVKVNCESVGVYRVQYTSETLDRFIPAIKDKTLPPRDRLGLQSDLFALARAGMISTVDVLKVVGAFINEDNYTVWSDLSSNLGQISILLQNTDGYNDFKAFNKRLFKPVAQSLGWDSKEGEGPLAAMLRDLALTRLGKCGDEDTISEAKKRFDAHVSGESPLPADLKGPVYVTVMVNGDEDAFNKIMKLYDEADMQEEKVRISRCMGSIQSDDLKKKVLDFAMSDKVRSQDTVFVVGGVTGTVQGRELCWQFLQDRWTDLHDRYKGGFLLSRLVEVSTENFVTEARAKEVEKFFESHPAPAAERKIQQSVENILLNAKWMERESAKVVEFLRSQ
ncbi:puromycin-sensitive aminopeptidase-like isoform X2 [Ostrea edulis]|uniref:puromycin-sensitive aminopeptidase-like isoform X2 n=1 Tax=Ostrea edulis TaxID=37623 RepID=UPI0020947272|nr:puromycin-sensitive aminopeptidase-like isoform X2 [Ostrea edulis]